MTARRPRFRFEPMTMTWAEAADVAFRRGETWLRDHLAEFPTFPKPDHDTNLFLAEQVRDWLRARYGMVPSSNENLKDLVWERAKNGKGPRAVSR